MRGTRHWAKGVIVFHWNPMRTALKPHPLKIPQVRAWTSSWMTMPTRTAPMKRKGLSKQTSTTCQIAGQPCRNPCKATKGRTEITANWKPTRLANAISIEWRVSSPERGTSFSRQEGAADSPQTGQGAGAVRLRAPRVSALSRPADPPDKPRCGPPAPQPGLTSNVSIRRGWFSPDRSVRRDLPSG